MTRRPLASSWLLLAAASFGGACDEREIPVFDVPVSAGVPGSSGSAGAAGSSAATGGSTSGASGAANVSGGVSGSVAGGGAATGGSSAGAFSAGASGSGSGGGPPLIPCASQLDCKYGWLCEKSACDALMGVCAPRPFVFCPAEPDPVCGCDGVTYWNDCVRRQTGAQLQAPGECGITACRCDVDSDCADDAEFAVCARLAQGGDDCHSTESGVCWVLPPQCMPNDVDKPSWRECRPPDQPPAPCVDTCQAIASGRLHKRQKITACIPPP